MDPLRHGCAIATLAAALCVAANSGEITVGAAHAESAAVPAPAPVAQPENPHAVEDRVLIDYLSQRHRIDRERTGSVIDLVREASRETDLDPLLVLAVIAIESSFNPLAESVAGAKGLMQIIPMWHRDKLDPVGGEAAVLDPSHNIFVGTRILREYIERWGGLQPGLQRYNGAAWDETAGYARKVFAEQARLRAVLARI